MAMNIRYTAKRDIYATHSVGTIYTTGVIFTSLERTNVVDRVDARALSGSLYSTYRDLRATWKMSTVGLSGIYVLLFREFTSSVIGGEPFELDIGDGNGYKQMQLTNKKFKEKRTVMRGGGGNDDDFVFSWTCREKR
tara:strand:- start:2823 stop:3233 length:411 start_codon:yes stop_codon:yes gene_type:complete